MTLALEPMGSFVVRIDPRKSWRFPNGPFGERSTTTFDGIDWDCEHFRARSLWANGTYRSGPRVLEVEVRAMMQLDDESLLYVQYTGRADFPTHSAGETPVISVGRCEAPEPGPLGWLNDTAIAGKGMLDLAAGTQAYDWYALR